MKFSCIFVITFWCTLYISEKSTAERDENFVNQLTVETSTVTLEKKSETDISDMMHKKAKTISRDGTFVNQPTVETSTVIMENSSEHDILDIIKGRKGKKPKSIRNCLDLKNQGKSSGTYLIKPCYDTPEKLVKVYCDMDTDGGGWTVIQRRGNYPKQEDFYGTWYEYALGFGNVSQDFWLGNDNIHCLTAQTHNEIRFDLGDWGGYTRYAKYRFFYIDDRTTKYKLEVQNYTGNAGDSMIYHSNMTFTTYDFDSDLSGGNCAKYYYGGWWYRSCHHSNLNGLYNVTSNSKGVNWYHWKGYTYSLKKTEMKIRPNYY